MNLSVFSQLERDGGPGTAGARFDVMLASIHYGACFDVLAILRNLRTGQITHRLFEHEPDDRHAQRATEWVQILLDLKEPSDVLRSPASAHVG